MALTNENGMGFSMPVAPAYAGYGMPYGGGMFGGGDDWLGLLFLIALCNGGFGFGGFGGGWGMVSPLASRSCLSLLSNILSPPTTIYIIYRFEVIINVLYLK